MSTTRRAVNTSPTTVRVGTPRIRAYTTNRAERNEPRGDRIKRHVVVDANGCWVWQLALTPVTGYGALTIDYKQYKAHRVSYEVFVGPIPDGLHIDHLCRNRACVNPAHLEPVTPQVNMLRGESPGAKAHRRELCEHGHPYAEFGVMRHGRRVCRFCRVTYSRIYRSMTRDEREDRRSRGLPMVDLGSHFAAEAKRAA